MDRNFVYDYTMKNFVESGTCAEEFFFVEPSDEEVLEMESSLRRNLHCIIWSVIKAKEQTVMDRLRLIFENFTVLVVDIRKQLELEYEDDQQLRSVYQQYYEDVVDFFQLLVTRRRICTMKEALEELELSTRRFVAGFMRSMDRPAALQIYEHHEKLLNQKLAKFPENRRKLIEQKTTKNSDEDMQVEDDDDLYWDASPEIVPESERGSLPRDELGCEANFETVLDEDSEPSLYIVEEPDSEPEGRTERFQAEVQLQTSHLLGRPGDVTGLTGANAPCFDPSSESDDVNSDVTSDSNEKVCAKTDQLQRSCETSPGGDNVVVAGAAGPSQNHSATPRPQNASSASAASGGSEKDSVTPHRQSDSTPAPAVASVPSSQVEESEAASTEAADQPDSDSFVGLELDAATTKVQHKKRTFCAQTDAMLIHGVNTYGTGSWKIIRDNYKFPAFRTHVHLKDRWRTLLAKNIVSYENGKVKILKRAQAEEFQKLSDSVEERKKRSTPTIRLNLSKRPAEETRDKPATSRAGASRGGKLQQDEDSSDNGDAADEEEISGQRGTETRKGNPDEPLTSRYFSLRSRKRADEDQTGNPSTSHPGNDDAWIRKKRRRRLWDCEGEMLTWNDDPIVKPNSASKLLAPPSRFSERKNRRKPWSEAEVANLVKGLRRFGVGQWAMILDSFNFSNRNSVMLKDKYRNMLKNDELPRDLLPASR